MGIYARLSNVAFELRDQRGQGLVEYGLIIAVVSLGLIAALTFLRDNIGDLFSEIASSVADVPSETTP